jgi:hypothetical protein
VFFENCTEEEKTAGKTPRVQNESFVSKKSSKKYNRKMIQRSKSSGASRNASNQRFKGIVRSEESKAVRGGMSGAYLRYVSIKTVKDNAAIRS